MGGINIDELTKETIEKLGIKRPPPIGQVAVSLIALGRVFSAIKGLPDEEALRVLQRAQIFILKRIFPEIEEDQEPYVPPIGWTIQVVARAFNLTEDDLKQRGRKVEVVAARQVAMYLLRMLGNYTLLEVGAGLGGLSPATVSHGFQRVAKRLGTDQSLSESVKEIYAVLTGEIKK